MSSSRRWLIIFATVISILVIVTLFLVLLTKDEVTLLPENTPQGTVQRYLIAVQEKNYQKAYNYLSFDPTQRITTYDDWLRMEIGQPQISNQSSWKATLGKTTQNGDNSTVEVTIDIFHPEGFFGDTLHSQQIIFQLMKVDGNWLITSPTYIYWIY